MSPTASGRVIGVAVLTYRDDPALLGPQRAVLFDQRGAVAVTEEGRILWRAPISRLPERFRVLPVDDHGAALVLPGFIDTNIHFPQYRMLAAPGRDRLVQKITAAVVFCSVHAESAHAPCSRHPSTATRRS